LLRFVPPEYPPLAKQRHIRGIVMIELHVGKDGRITSTRLINGDPLLTEAALAAVRQWVYAPFMLNGEPVDVISTATVSFPPPAKAGKRSTLRQ
jgi:protein TonB